MGRESLTKMETR